MIKVLHITWSAHFGGIEKLALETCKCQLSTDVVQPTICFGKYEGEMLSLFHDHNIPTISGNLKTGKDFSPKKYQELKKVFSRYDVLHFHGFNPLMAFVAASSDNNIVYTEHGNFAFGRKQSFFDKILMRWRAYFIREKVGMLLFNSHFTKEYALKLLNLGQVNRRVLYNGVNQPSGTVMNKAEDLKEKLKGYFVIGAASRFAGFKRLPMLVEAFAGLKEKEKARLLLVGDGPQREELEGLVRKFGIWDKTIFTGYRKDIDQVASWIDVFCIPSKNEPFGLTVIENLNEGRPVLVMSDGGGAKELIEQVEPENICADIADLTAKMAYCMNNQEKMVQMKPLRRKFAAQFSIEHYCSELDRVYQELVNVRD